MFWAVLRQSPVPFVEAHQPGIALFRTCRQIYEEAASIFYQRNTFAIARKYTRWDHQQHDIHGYFILEAALWLSQLGDQLHRLRKLFIDHDTICPSYCPPRGNNYGPIVSNPVPRPRGFFNIGPLLRMV